jgi:hypothetical protein
MIAMIAVRSAVIAMIAVRSAVIAMIAVRAVSARIKARPLAPWVEHSPVPHLPY